MNKEDLHRFFAGVAIGMSLLPGTAEIMPTLKSALSSAEAGITLEMSESNVVADARELTDTMAYSREGLIKELSNTYTIDEIESALDELQIDFHAEAIEAARNYSNLGMDFDRQGLINRLTVYGDGFTQGEAEHAANELGY